MAATLVRGKVVELVGPFTLFINPDTPFLQSFLTRLKTRSDNFLFLKLKGPPTKNELAAATTTRELELSKQLSRLGITADLRAYRRGGLSTMAANGYTLTEIREFSKHTSDKALNIYLERGRYSAGLALKQIEMTQYQLALPNFDYPWEIDED